MGQSKKSKPTGMKFEFYISVDGADYVPLDSLSADERAAATEKMVSRFAAPIEKWLAGKPEVWQTLCQEGTLADA